MKALLAFEPFHQDKKRIKGMHSTLVQLLGSAEKIEFGFIATRNESSLNTAFDIPEKDRFSSYPKRIISDELKRVQIKVTDKKIHVLDYPTMSTTKAVDRFLKLAKSQNCELIGIFTHAKEGFQRLLMGSFAETAIHHSRSSLLIFNPETQIVPKIKRVFFASDFTPLSKKHLQKVIERCKKLNAHLTIFHHAQVTYRWSLDEGNPKIHAYRRKVNQMKDWIEDRCRRSGVAAEVIIVADMMATSTLILEAMKKRKSHLLVVSAKSSPTTALLLGSVTRHVVRGSPIPVLVLK